MYTLIIVLNWNNAPDTLECLRSLAAVPYPGFSLIVVDNGSTDNSVRIIRENSPIEMELIETGANLGYAGGNNAGIRRALDMGAEVIGILNNDVTVEPGFLIPLLDALRAEPSVGVVTPLITDCGGLGHIWALGSSVNPHSTAVTRRHAGEPLGAWPNRPPHDVDVASGAAMLVERQVFEQVGLLDESFFLYYEEVDWSLLVRRAGYRIQAVPASLVWHKVSATLGSTSPLIDYYMLRNHLRLIARHWSGWQRMYLQARVILRALAAIAAFTIKPHGGARIPNRDARILALRDALQGRSGVMGMDVAQACRLGNR